MTYKCKHCGRPITGPSPQGTWFHLEYSEKCYNQHGPPEPDGLMPAPPMAQGSQRIEELRAERDALKAANAELTEFVNGLYMRNPCPDCGGTMGHYRCCEIAAIRAKHGK